MKQLKLEREPQFGQKELYGLITDERGEPLMLSMELLWNNNQVQKSCIPEGNYTVKPRKSQKYGQHFIVENVENRSHILIHVGNTREHTLGCILVGKAKGKINNHRAILHSRVALNELIVRYPQGFKLKIETANEE